MNRNVLSYRTMRKKERAISPIIATLLLILIAIAAGVVVYAYVIGFVGNTTGGSNVGNTQLSANLVAIKAATGVTTLVLENVGGTTAVLSAGLYLKRGTLASVAQQGWRVTLTSTSGAPTQITDIQVKQIADNSHITIQITQASGTVTYTASVFANAAATQYTITIAASTTGTCGTNIALPTGVTVSTGYIADTGAITITPVAATLTNFGVSTAAGSGMGTISISPGTTVETNLFAIAGTAAALTSGNIYTVQITANDGSTFTLNPKAS